MIVQLVSPEKTVFKGQAKQITLTTPQGEITILPKHVNLITALSPGELRIKKEDDEEIIFATGAGFAHISGTSVLIATDMATTPAEIDEEKVAEAKKRAEEALKERHRLSDEEFAATVASLERSLAQLKVKRRRHQHLKTS